MKAAKAKAHKQESAAYASGYKGNEMETIKCNFTGLTRKDTMEGREYLVAPMVMIVEGVLNGTQGPLMYPEEELSKTPEVWNHKPVTVYHPVRNGAGISACSPDVLTNHKIGVIMNTTFDSKDKKLKAEAWIDVERMNVVDSRVAKAIENKQIMELSTGVYTDNESQIGEFNGVAYEAIARNYRPDHLALLPDLTGACSVEAGAGFLRLNEFSHGNLRNLINTELRQSKPEAWIEEVYNAFFIYMDKDSKYYKLNYKETDGSITVEGSPIEVVRVVEFRAVNGIFVANSKGETMDKEKLVKDLISNKATQWGEDDKDALMGMDENVLTKMVPVENKQEEEVQEAAEQGAGETGTPATPGTPPLPPATPATPAEPAPATPATPVENKTTEQYIAELPKEIQPMLQNGLKMYNQSKERLISLIIANEKNTFKKEYLQTKDVDELKAIAQLASNTSTPVESERFNDFSGQGETPEATQNTEEPLDIPIINFKPEPVPAPAPAPAPVAAAS